jgi:hypothetical protein
MNTIRQANHNSVFAELEKIEFEDLSKVNTLFTMVTFPVLFYLLLLFFINHCYLFIFCYIFPLILNVYRKKQRKF